MRPRSRHGIGSREGKKGGMTAALLFANPLEAGYFMTPT